MSSNAEPREAEQTDERPNLSGRPRRIWDAANVEEAVKALNGGDDT